MIATFKCHLPVGSTSAPTLLPAVEALLRRLAVHPRHQEAGVERIAGAGGVDHLHLRRRRRGCRDPARATPRRASPSLTMVIALRCAPVRDRGLERRLAGVEPRFELVDEDEVERVDQIGQAAIVGERLVPAEVPRRGDAALAEPRRRSASSSAQSCG